MELNFTELLYSLSLALDSVEHELTGISSGHAKRVGYMSCLMAKEHGFEGTELSEFTGCAVLHDNALAEYITEEFKNNYVDAKVSFTKLANMSQLHCVAGERNIQMLPFKTDVRDVILFHHEHIDGSGAFGKKESEINLKSQIIQMADYADTVSDLAKLTEAGYSTLVSEIKSQTGKIFSAETVRLFLSAVTFEKIHEMNRETVDSCLRKNVPSSINDYSDQEIRNIALTFAKIVDYKSSFTKNHSLGVAEIADRMAEFYGFAPEKRIRFYFAAALHDIGKLIIPNDILEKPGKLSDQEFTRMKTHAYATYERLVNIDGLEDIALLASRHHEKLDGSGYPFGLKENELSFEEQLLGCVDIYQALTENRPYKEGFSHQKTMGIMQEMAGKGQLSREIVETMDKVLSQSHAE